jgi:hypothetical protein
MRTTVCETDFVVGGLSGTLNGFAEVVPKIFVVALEVVSVLAAFSLSLLMSDSLDEQLLLEEAAEAVLEVGSVNAGDAVTSVFGEKRQSWVLY